MPFIKNIKILPEEAAVMYVYVHYYKAVELMLKLIFPDFLKLFL